MRGVEPEHDHLAIHFDRDEAALLASIVDQLAELLRQQDMPVEQIGPVAEAADPFAQWEAEFSGSAGPTVEDPDLDALDQADPVIRRLFPDAYPDDPAASHDFRRFTQPQQRSRKVADAQLVVADLQQTSRKGICRIPLDHATAWLKTLTNVRLSLAARLDITDEVSAEEAAQRPKSDPRAWMHEIYQWTGWVQECLVEAL
ncbi:DUF2017 domain-containing protein [Luteococcus sp. Sow4_B9]|uniref:DUF2017 domain-containing protein n=1 Tax=Luteococcus sp. Sow4_B9 TaxID=3438792 RepID=UPI003F9513A6